MIEAHAVPIPSDSVLAPLYVGADLLDAFAIHLRAGASDDPEVLARVAFERQAAWIRGGKQNFQNSHCGIFRYFACLQSDGLLTASRPR